MSTTVRTSAPAESDRSAAASTVFRGHAQDASGRRPVHVAIHVRWASALGAVALLALMAAWAMGPFVVTPPMAAEDLPLLALVLLFAAAAAVVWVAGIRLSDTTDVLSTRLGLGEALGGLLLLAVATNLPEVAIVASAAMGGDLGLAIGNILGGIAIQTVVLVAL